MDRCGAALSRSRARVPCLPGLCSGHPNPSSGLVQAAGGRGNCRTAGLQLLQSAVKITLLYNQSYTVKNDVNVFLK